MISSKTAIERAVHYVKELFPGQEPVLLEEIDRTPDDSDWLITLSFPEKPAPHAARKYKVLRVSGEVGEVRSMKIHEAATFSH